MISNEEYAATQTSLIFLGQIVAGIDIDGFIERISLTNAVGPVLDPTLYLEAGDRLGNVERLARSLKPFKAEVERQMKESKGE